MIAFGASMHPYLHMHDDSFPAISGREGSLGNIYLEMDRAIKNPSERKHAKVE